MRAIESRMRIRCIFLLFLSTTLVDAGFFDFISKLAGGGSSSSSSSASSVKKAPPVTDDKAKVFRKFQEFAGLKPTGELDVQTKQKMAEPRCGVTDVLAVTSGGAAFKWRKNRLTYSIENFSPDLPREDTKRAIREAYDEWSAVTPLEFEEVPAGSGADIKVRFGSGNHNDPWPFDGKGGVLAHATMPENGALHFDDDEKWVYMDAKKISSGDYTDILAVAIHEGGHTLGLSHSRDETSIMAPFYHETVDSRGNYVRPTLKRDDIQSIQDIYDGGSRATTERTTTKSWFGRFFGGSDSTTTSRPSRPSFGGGDDSSFGGGRGGGGGSSFGGSSSGTSGQCPRSVDAFAPSGAPTYVEAAVFNPNSGMMLLFGNRQVYGYYYSRVRAAFKLDAGYPKRLPSDIPYSPSGALRWVNGHQILLSNNDEFSVYDEFWNQSTLKNRISSYFPNLPSGVKGIESPSGSTVTAFTSNMVFQYNSRTKRVESEMTLSDYLQC
ncbi:unnamed protein product [Nippostrongylus brasiliensis]|uniref:Matrix metalloproteinase (inferred by orthology to a C. elegans protein) n=1 Tax=Nippostrongylus brasiliensis TaxID=27835 RepID=A0A158QYU6_NIPBR|nr:unnamed protein product [Nippostrongylus brasiliensis]